MSDKLAICNNALAETGNNTVAVEGDGSDEWNVASRAYERALPLILSTHPFNFATITETLEPSATNPSQRFSGGYAFRVPTNALHVRTVFVGGQALKAGEYEIVDRKICCNASEIQALYVRAPPSDQWPPLFVEALTKRVEAGCLRGLNEDMDAADRREAYAISMLQEAKTNTDQQAPGRVVLRSRIAARRRGGGTINEAQQ